MVLNNKCVQSRICGIYKTTRVRAVLPVIKTFLRKQENVTPNLISSQCALIRHSIIHARILKFQRHVKPQKTTKSKKTNENDYFSARTLINRRSLFFVSVFIFAPQHNSPVLDADRVAHAPLNKAIIIITIEQINRTYIPFKENIH